MLSRVVLLIVLSIILFFIGLWGVLNVHNNILVILMSYEIMLYSQILLFLGAGVIYNDILGQIMSLIILTIAAAESAISLAIVVSFYRLKGTLELSVMEFLKG